ncbi:hypothetical protein QLS71_003030 [Mariniflexile litorale]|uniref:F5/8 type C domain-containing protein n=1 Tax=Mariniflexile litorale TaxID=3045158 RepID=A0AAU7EH78_9FLAO|nr:hypothetical protein [Mariniflexile sp. KMM 9835]MDQ8209993.1 hypothetical protein [Mariniflexile sp. KMM 9835]
MKKITAKFILLIIIIGLNSCANKDADLENALELAGDNRVELEKVLDHYKAPKDSLKYKAASFLIVNMPYYFYKDGQGLQAILAAKDSLKNEYEKIPNFKEKKIIGMLKTEKFINFLKSLESRNAYSSLSADLKNYSDIENISSDFLIENIDYAFKAWNLPWARHLTFDQFSEYILPYRSGQQKPNAWRKYYFNKYKPLIDSLANESDPVLVCKILNEKLLPLYKPFRGSFNIKMSPFTYSIPGPFMTELGIDGNCVMVTSHTVEVMRSLGIPITRLFTDKDGFSGGNHLLVAVLDTLGQWQGFHCGGQNPGDFEPESQITKIYKESSIPKNNNSELKKRINSKLSHFEWDDVTEKFTDVYNVTIKAPKIYKNNEIAYLCIFDPKAYNTWVPIDGAALEGDHVTFKNIGGKEVVYLAMVENDNGILDIPISSPFVLNVDGTLRYLEPEKEYTFYEFERKFPYNSWFVDLSKPLIGGRFEGSNFRDFRNAVELCRIKETPIDDDNIIDIKDSEFRFVRFVYPKIMDDSKYGLASLSFYTSDNNKLGLTTLKGDYIFSKGVTKENMDILFDEDLLTYVNVYKYENGIETSVPTAIFSDAPPNLTWVGLDLGIKQKVTHVGFAPRNPKNNVYPGMVYELFYWDNQWKSLGVKTASKNSIEYSNIPKGALLWLKNHTEGKEERIFFIENNQIVWK